MKTIQAELHAVTVPDNRRRKSGPVSVIAESMKRLGLINPITLTEDLVLVSGLHRFEAAQSLGWERIDARIIDADARLVEIDENLCRNELTALERAEHRSERKRLHEAVYPEVRNGRNQYTRASVDESRDGHGVQPSTRQEPGSYSGTAATEERVAARTIRRSVAIAENIPEDVRDEIRDLPIADNQKELSRLSKHAPEIQQRIAAHLSDGVAKVKNAERIIEQEDAPEAAESGLESVDLRLLPVADVIATLDGVALVHADPPWAYDNQRLHGTVDGHYEDGGMDAITAAIDSAFDAAVDDSYLLLWCTLPMLRDWFIASHDMRWRFLSAGAWVKTGGRPGIGFHWRGRAEALLLYAKGAPKPRRDVTPNAHISAIGEHSEKPVDWLESLLHTFCAPGGTVLDLYAGRAPMARACVATDRRYVGAETDKVRHAQAMDALLA